MRPIMKKIRNCLINHSLVMSMIIPLCNDLPYMNCMSIVMLTNSLQLLIAN